LSKKPGKLSGFFSFGQQAILPASSAGVRALAMLSGDI
jgi:hypothetical protein